MKKFVHYHNVGTGIAFFSTAVEFEDGEDAVTGLNELLSHSSARLAQWDEERQAGVFIIGTLPGLIVLTDDEKPMSELKAQRLFLKVRLKPQLEDAA